MYLCSQRVVRPATGAEGINTFRYIHGPQRWSGEPPQSHRPEVNPGILEAELVTVPPPGNRVRSFLDVVAPDGTKPNAVALAALRPPPSIRRFPVEWTHGNVWCRFAVDETLVGRWKEELEQLARGFVELWKSELPR